MRRQIAALKATASPNSSPELDLPSSLLLGPTQDIKAVEGETFNKGIKLGSSQVNRMGIQEQFYRDLEVTTDGFSTVAEYFGRSAFN